MANEDGPFMEEAVQCTYCNGFLELSACYFCDDCKKGYCQECMHEEQSGLCKGCGDAMEDEDDDPWEEYDEEVEDVVEDDLDEEDDDDEDPEVQRRTHGISGHAAHDGVDPFVKSPDDRPLGQQGV